MGTSWISRKGAILEKGGGGRGEGYDPPYQLCEQEYIEVLPILVSLILNQVMLKNGKKDVFYDLF